VWSIVVSVLQATRGIRIGMPRSGNEVTGTTATLTGSLPERMARRSMAWSAASLPAEGKLRNQLIYGSQHSARHTVDAQCLRNRQAAEDTA